MVRVPDKDWLNEEAKIDHSETVTRYEPDLTLIGLRLIYERNT